MAASAFFIVTSALAVEIESRPLKFMTKAGEEIETYCAVSLYYRSTGIGWGVESQGRKSDPQRYLMWPSIIKKGEGFAKMKRQRGSGIALFGIMPVGFGEEFGINRTLFLKKGFAPLLWSTYIDHTKVREVQMIEGDSIPALNALIADQPDQKLLQEIFGLKDDQKIESRYTESDRQMLQNCYFRDSD